MNYYLISKLSHMYLSSIEFPTASHKCEKTKNVIELACLSHTMKTGADSENSEIGVQNPCQLYRHCIYLFLKRIFFKSYIISQKGRWGVRSPWTTPKSTHGQVLIKGEVSEFKLQVTFYKLLDSHCNFPCTCIIKKHFRENLIPHVHTH